MEGKEDEGRGGRREGEGEKGRREGKGCSPQTSRPNSAHETNKHVLINKTLNRI